MSRFNTPAAVPPRPTPDARTHEGGAGFKRDAKDALFVLGIANFVGQDDFYETGEVRDKRMVDLVHEVTRTDPAWLVEFARWLRNDANMRTASIIVAAEYVKAGGANGRQVVASVLRRPDEPAEMIGYWVSRHGRNIPKPVKRGIADAAQRMYTERNTLKYDGTNHTIRFADVIRLAHVAPRDATQAALFTYLDALRRKTVKDDAAAPALAALDTIREDRRLMALPADQRRANLGAAIEAGWAWERLAGWLPDGMNAEAWEAVIPNMGVMALLRNLRNFDDRGVSAEAADLVKAKIANRDDIARSRVFPIQYLSAWRAVTSVRWAEALEAGLNASLVNVPALSGRSLILIDSSGSMANVVGTRRVDGGRRGERIEQLQRWEVAGVFGCALAARGKADIVLFDGAPRARVEMGPHDSILRVVGAMKSHVVGGWTRTLESLAATYNGHDRVLIIGDEQTAGTAWHLVQNIKCPVLTWNLGGFANGHTPSHFENWQTYGGLTDAAFNMLRIMDQRRNGGWPWEFPAEDARG